MWLLRLLAVITAIVVAGSALAYLLTRDASFLLFAKRLAIFVLVAALLVFALLIVERVALIAP
jgi:hypothetical protein